MSTPISRSTIPLLAIAILLACGGAPPEPAAPSAEQTRRPARTLEIPGAQPGDAQAGNAHGAVLQWDAPAGWQPVAPASPMRLAQYRVSGPGGEAECVVYYFGPGQGGDARANAVRWAGQFEQPDGRPSVDVMTVSALSGGAVPVQIVEVRGTYDGGMTMTDVPAEKQPGFMLLGGIADGPDAPWFFKFTGPAATVEAQRESFETLLRSLRVGT
jgi:hypothetical protein